MSDEGPDIGVALRRRRKIAGWTLDGLAARSGVSSAMLSEIERGRKNPTVKLAYQVARALGCSLTELLEEGVAESCEVVMASERRRLDDPESGVVRFGLSPEAFHHRLEIVWYELPVGASVGEMAPNLDGVVEFATVFRGQLEFRHGEQCHQLGPGDSVSYGAQSTMEYRNAGPETCEVFLVCERSPKA